MGAQPPKVLKLCQKKKKSLPSDMADYTNENIGKCIPDKDVREAILSKY